MAEPSGSTTLATVFQDYITAVLPGKAPRTQYLITRLVRQWRPDLGPLRLEQLTPAVLTQWRDRLLARYAPASVIRYLEVLSGILSWAVQQGRLPDNPLRFVERPPPPPPRLRFLEPPTCQRLLEACAASRAPHLYPLVRLALYTGLTKRELLALRWRDVCLATHGLTLPPRSLRTPRRHVPCVQPAWDLLMQQRREPHPPPGEWVFPRSGGQGLSGIDAAWRRACAAADLPGLRFRDLQTAALPYLLAQDVPPPVIAQIVGHTNGHLGLHMADLLNAEVAQALAALLGPRRRG